MLLPWIAANQRRVRPNLESDWTIFVGKIMRRVGLIYPAAGQIDTLYKELHVLQYLMTREGN